MARSTRTAVRVKAANLMRGDRFVLNGGGTGKVAEVVTLGKKNFVNATIARSNDKTFDRVFNPNDRVLIMENDASRARRKIYRATRSRSLARGTNV